MKVLYDHQIFNWQKVGGASRYFVELMERLPRDIKIYNSILFSNNEYLRNSSHKLNKGLNIPNLKISKKIIDYCKLESKHSLHHLKNDEYDIFHPLYCDPYYLEITKKRNKPVVQTIHDMVFEKFPQFFNKATNTIENKRITALNADRIIAVSENTKKDIIQILNIPSDKIDVVYHGHSMILDHSTPVPNLPDNYILFVGARDGYKNFSTFLKAFEIIHKKNKDIFLVCTGNSFNKQEEKLIKELGLSNFVKNYFVSDSQLTYLYQNAICFVFPSLYEGFGIPILESFAAGCPVVLSNTSCFPEIADNAGAFFDPYDIEDMANTIQKILDDKSYRKILIKNGNLRLSHFSWDKTAQETVKVYQKIIGK